jgi:hypothetical protein
MGIDPTIWGSKMWTMIHLICLQAPETIDTNVRNAYYTFFTMMPYVLPCDKCREHWIEHVREHPLEQVMDTRDDLFRWSVDMHNLVNKSLGKPDVSYEVALEHWKNISRGIIPTSQCIDTGINTGESETFQSFSKRMSPMAAFILVIAIIVTIIVSGFFAFRDFSR